MKKHLQDEADVVGLIAKLQEQLTSLDRKIDTLINRSLQRPPETKPFYKPFQRPGNPHTQDSGRRDDSQRDRFMHKAICADCKKECEVPFRPSQDRPVYCKECFSRRKTGNSFQANIDNSPKEAVPVQASNLHKPQTDEKKRFGARKKFAEKKRPFFKKKKSRK